MRTTRRRGLATVVAGASLLTGCGVEVAQPAVPTVVAQPVDAPADVVVPATRTDEPASDDDDLPTDLSASDPPLVGPGTPPDEDEPADDGGPDDADRTAPVVDDGRPSRADTAAFVARADLDGAAAVEHVLADLDGDDLEEVLLTGLRDGRGVLAVAWWDGDGYEVLAEGEAGRGSSVARLQVGDVNRDGATEVLMTVEDGSLSSLAVWNVPKRGKLAELRAKGGCHETSHVYGVIGARLVEEPDGPPSIVATCDDSPLPQADWSEQRWRWDGRHYRVVEPEPGPTERPDPDDDEDDPDDDEDDEPDDDERDEKERDDD